MGLATLGGHTFRLDPTSIEWSYTIKLSETPTVGGKVVQVYGAEIGDLTVSGSFGVGGWKEQAEFLKAMKEVANKQVYDSVHGRGADPLVFAYPPRDWHFYVYLTGYTDGRSSRAVDLANENLHNPGWQLTLMIVEGVTADLRQASIDDFITRLSEGIGWHRTKYNGQLLPEEIQAVSQGLSIYDQPHYQPNVQTARPPRPGEAAVPSIQ